MIVYGTNATPKEIGTGKFIACCLQQILAIMAATILVPLIVSTADLQLSPTVALFGAGAGTIVYQLFVKRKSPVFLGSSFAFLGAMSAAVTAGYGFWGLILGALFAGLVYVAFAIVVKFVGVKWLNKLLQPQIIGATVAIIGLSLSGTATSWAMSNGVQVLSQAKDALTGDTFNVFVSDYNLISILCALATFLVIVVVSAKGNKTMKLIPFIIGIGSGYVLAGIFTAFGYIFDVDYLKVIDFSQFVGVYGSEFGLNWFIEVPHFTLVEAIKGGFNLNAQDIGAIALMYMPVALVVLAEHIADHKNLSTIINQDLMEDPGLPRTLLGDGVGSMVGALFGACPNTTYGESVGCVAITGNASCWTIIGAAIGCMVLSFLTPIETLIASIPKCVMGGACIALYGFIAVSGLKMLKNVDLNKNSNLFVVSAIMVCGIGGLVLNFGKFQITTIATALVVGIITNLLVGEKENEQENDGSTTDDATTATVE